MTGRRAFVIKHLIPVSHLTLQISLAISTSGKKTRRPCGCEMEMVCTTCSVIFQEALTKDPFVTCLSNQSLNLVDTGNLLPGMRHLCVLRANLSGLKGSLTRHTSPYFTYWRLDYEVIINFKRAKLQAKLRWTENVRPVGGKNEFVLTPAIVAPNLRRACCYPAPLSFLSKYDTTCGII